MTEYNIDIVYNLFQAIADANKHPLLRTVNAENILSGNSVAKNIYVAIYGDGMIKNGGFEHYLFEIKLGKIKGSVVKKAFKEIQFNAGFALLNKAKLTPDTGLAQLDLEYYRLNPSFEDILVQYVSVNWDNDDFKIYRKSIAFESEPLIPSSVEAKESTALYNQLFYGAQLMDACEKGDLETVKAILEKKDDLINVSIDGDTPVSKAIPKVKVLEYLLSKGADFNTCGEKRELFPIHHAAIDGKNTAIKAFLKYGADVNALTKTKKRTALHVILNISSNQYHWNRFKLRNTLKLLLKNNADMTIKDINSQTPLDMAIHNKNEEALLIIKEFQAKKI